MAPKMKGKSVTEMNAWLHKMLCLGNCIAYVVQIPKSEHRLIGPGLSLLTHGALWVL